MSTSPINDAFQTEQGHRRWPWRRRVAPPVSATTRCLPHAPDEQGSLAQGIIDLVRAGVVGVRVLKKFARRRAFFRQAAGMGLRRGAADVKLRSRPELGHEGGITWRASS